VSRALAEVKEYMPSFKTETQLAVSVNELAHDSLNMSGVNYELGPLLKMSAPDNWQSKPITDWPTNQNLFISTILLLGLIPIDRHYFNFKTIDSFGFNENSKSLMNKLWSHERKIKSNGSGSVITDVIIYKSKLGILGNLFMPIYKALFKHRHNRLRAKYSKLNS
jgi:hypothetical protein